MSLSKGDHLGSYEILGPLGAGGMGEVYRARDAALDRDVAVKVLPTALAQHPERLARFDREAKVLAALNHPNIAVIYGLENRAIVMELVEGPTLGDRIRAGALPLDEALKIAAQIADALEAAHEKGVVHRDLKPANVKVREDGTVKVLDFGLATAVQAGGREASEAANSPTLTMGATEAGTILGTASYMSPEQAAGKPVDRRADIWSFGVVLWEMLTGRRLFQGETVSHTLADVLRSPVDLAKLPADTPAPIRELMKRCLDRDVKTRLRDIGEARIAIQKWIADPVAQAISSPASGLGSQRLPWAIAAACAIVAIAFGITWYSSWSAVPPLKPLVRLEVDLGADVQLGSANSLGKSAIISPDGTRLVYVSHGRLFTRRLDQPHATELPGTASAYGPFFSPDGQWVAFSSGGKLKKISVGGGTAVTLCDAPFLLGGSWGEDDSIIAALGVANGLVRIPPGGGTPTPLTDVAQGEVTHRWPQVLPGGKAVLYTAHRAIAGGFDAANIQVKALPNGATKTVQQGGTFGRYIATPRGGYLTYLTRGTLFAVPFDLDRLEVRGSPAPLLDSVGMMVTGLGEVDVSREGTLVYRGGSSGSNLVTVQWMDRAGRTEALISTPGNYGRFSLSPNGERLAVESGDSTDIWIYDRRRENLNRLTTVGSTLGPIWSPDGRYIVYQDPAGGTSWVRADGGQPQPLTKGPNTKQQWPWSFSPDGKWLALFQNAAGGFDLWTVPMEIDDAGIRAGKPEVFYASQFDMRAPVFSPDGHWIAYASNESGTFEVYVRAFPDKGGRQQISSGGASYPMWSRGAKELLYETLDNHIMVAGYTVRGDSFVWEKPRLWAEKSIGGAVNNIKNVNLAPDGKHIVALMPVQSQEAQTDQNHVTFLLNFFDEVQRRTGGAAK